MKPIRLAFIGVGSQGRKHLLAAQTLEKKGLVTIVASCDPALSIPIEGVSRHYQLYGELFANESFDAVVVAAPNVFHLEIIKIALAKNCLVIKEKPLAMTVKEAEQVKVMIKKSKGAVVVCQQRLYKQSWLELRALLPLMGKPLSFSYQFVVNDKVESWYWNRHLAGGGVWLNMGWHALQVLQWLWGDFRKVELVSNIGGARPWHYDTDHTTFARITMSSGLRGVVFVSCVHSPTEFLRIKTERGLVVLHNEKLWLYHSGGWEFVTTEQQENPYELQLQQALYWWQQGRKGKQVLRNEFDNYQSLLIILEQASARGVAGAISSYLASQPEKVTYA